MIHIACEQGTSEWAALRIGLPTSSQFHRILTPKTLKFSSSTDAYARELLAESDLGEPLDNATSGFMQRGSIQEHKAVQFYELQNDVETTPAGFVLRDDRRVGSSPDRFVGSDGLLEVKCPAAATHIEYLLDEEGIGYKTQVQGQLWICERSYCDTVSFNPRMSAPAAIVRQYRDEEFIGKLAPAVNQFLEMMDDMKEKLQRRGMFPDFKRPELRVA